MKRNMLHIAISLGTCWFYACQSESSGGGRGGGGGGATSSGDDLKNVSYDKEIASLLKTYCVSCHGSTDPDLSSYAAAKSAASASLASIKDGSMPPKSSKQMTATAIKQFEAWVKNGTKRSASSTNSSSSSTSTGSSSSSVTYNSWVASYIDENCVSCHSSKVTKGGVDLSTYDLAVEHAQSSYDSMKAGTMPPSSAPSSSIVSKMKAWIDAGTPEDTEESQAGSDSSSGSKLTWEGNIKSWMESNCSNSGCHDSVRRAGGYDLSTQAKFKSNASKAMNAINNDRMPISAPASQEDRDKLQQWIDAGMP